MSIAIEGCGHTAAQLTPGESICLPGSVLSGCPNVNSFNNNPQCKYYVLQAGESIATISLGLNLFQPDVEAVNPDIVQGNLQVGDLLKLPGWNEAKCGLLPNNITQLLYLAPSPPPPILPPNTPPKPNGPNSKNPNPSPKPTTFQAPPSQADAEKCRGFRARDADDLFSIAALFSIDVAQLISVNPDLGGGIPVLPGVVVKIPPYDPTCSTPVLIDAQTLLAPPPMSENTPPQVALRPVNGGGAAATPAAEGPAPPTPAAEKDAEAPANGSFVEGAVKLPPTDNATTGTDTSGADPTTTTTTTATTTSGPDGGLGGADTIVADDTTLQNIVRDGGNSNAPPPPQSGSNTGNIIMGMTIFVVCVALIGLLGMAFSGTAPMRLGMKKEVAPIDAVIV